MMTRRQKFLPEEDWVMYRDGNIPAIVDEELWEKANEVFRHRSRDVKGNLYPRFKQDKTDKAPAA